uniref:Rab-GAP TBC domain-containing protein n=1 Tax=Compsopogon caeruleus TaxID=31354 RepID=A0A7S1TC88_9RHOD|mmetsp:Transcript_13784/g.28294  ORF Transcript_13784/g.28294 Transcript_13784/m.28294 type:complete len:329 (+) Transcript_13784:186-1172(+)
MGGNHSGSLGLPSKRPSNEELEQLYWDVLRKPDTMDVGHVNNTRDPVDRIRKLLGKYGLPDNASEISVRHFPHSSLRGVVWKVLLRIGRIDVDGYVHLVSLGPSKDDEKIRSDASRTFARDGEFIRRVSREQISRLLNAFVHLKGNRKGAYIQSMSLLSAPFLYLMPEPEAFDCFRSFLASEIPEYVRNYAGVREGCKLLDEFLAIKAPDLHRRLTAHGLHAEHFAFSSISTLNAFPSVSDTVRLWDFELAFGAHWAVLFILARLVIASQRLLIRGDKGNAPLITRDLEEGFGIEASRVIEEARALSASLDAHLIDRLRVHPKMHIPD